MSALKLTPTLYTKEVEETVKFYTEKLGFICINNTEDWTWAALSLDEIEIMFSVPNQHIPFPAPTFTGSFYILTDDVEELWKEYKDKVEVCYPLETFDYGMREFAVYDNNGYLLQFGQDVE